MNYVFSGILIIIKIIDFIFFNDNISHTNKKLKMQNKIVIAVDGHSAAGKGTLCKLLSEKLNIPHLNTGGLYRAVAYKAIQNGVSLDDEAKVVEIAKTIDENDIGNPLIFTEEIGAKASIVAKIQAVRDVLFQYQKDFANQSTGAILEGRDIGTVICPDADYKFFMTALFEERAKRRFKEMKEKGQNVAYQDIFDKMKKRDETDMNRAASPFKKADDAILIDTTGKTIDEVFQEVLAFIK